MNKRLHSKNIGRKFAMIYILKGLTGFDGKLNRGVSMPSNGIDS